MTTVTASMISQHYIKELVLKGNAPYDVLSTMGIEPDECAETNRYHVKLITGTVHDHVHVIDRTCNQVKQLVMPAGYVDIVEWTFGNSNIPVNLDVVETWL